MRELFIVKSRTLGNCVVVTLPKAVRDKLELEVGDYLTLEVTGPDKLTAVVGSPQGGPRIKKRKKTLAELLLPNDGRV